MKRKICKFLGLLMMFTVILGVCPAALAAGADATFSSVLLTVGEDETMRNLTWYSEYEAKGEVRYGKSENGQLPAEYATTKAIAVKAYKEGYYAYKATMRGLEENTTYVYCLVVGNTISQPYSFKVKDFGDEFTFIHLADAQTSNTSHAKSWADTLEKVQTSFPEVSFILSAGDQTEVPTQENQYDYFISEHLSSLAVATTIGPPHDGTNRYRDHYNLPNVSSSYGKNVPGADYYYRYNNVLFIHLNVLSVNFPQHLQFIENTLADNPDCTWNIVVMHYNYVTRRDRTSVNAIVNGRKELMDDFSRLGIDAVLSGHDHLYVRSKLMLNDTTLSNDTVVDNTVTDPEGVLYLSTTKAAGTNFSDPTYTGHDQYIAYTHEVERKGGTIFRVTDTSLRMESYFLDKDQPELFDSFAIHKTPSADTAEPADTYTVRFVADPDATFGGNADPSVISQRRYTNLKPDAPMLYMPRFSMEKGEVYDWSWEYYQVDGNGSKVTEFAYGKEYVAYPVAAVTPIAPTLYIAPTADPQNYVYTWEQAWTIAQRCPDEEFTFVLTEDLTVSAAINLSDPARVTVDLNGKTLTAPSTVSYILVFASGSHESKVRFISSKANGAVNASREVLRLTTDYTAAIEASFGSESTQPITVTCKYLVFATDMFKMGASLKLNLYGGIYHIADGMFFVTNSSATNTSYNKYMVTAKNAQVNFSGADSCMVRSETDGGAHYSHASSHIQMDGCVFTDTYTTDHSSSRGLIRENIWKGTAAFNDCDFEGMSIGRAADGTALTAGGTIAIGEGCTFTNSDTTFDAENDMAFFSNKVTAPSGCIPARVNEKGTFEIVNRENASKITWHNPVGHSEYWKKGTTPVYQKEEFFDSSEEAYSLVVNGEVTPVSEDKTYTFKSVEGYLYRLDETTGIWQISKDGGNSYTNLALGNISCTVGDHAAAGHTKITQANFTDGRYTISVAGTYYLGEDVTGNITTTKAVTLCMCGHNITTNKEGSEKEDAAVYVNGGSLTLTNCKETGGTIKKTTAGAYGLRAQSGSVVIKAGVHVDDSATVGVLAVGTLTLQGGTVSGNASHGIQTGGSCHVYLKSGTISGNTGRGVWGNGGSVEMTGGKITGNKAADAGGGVAVTKGTFTLKGGEISANTTEKEGGGVYVSANGTFVMEGGTISGNTAANGGGVYVLDGAFNMAGGKISMNNAANNGKEVLIAGSKSTAGGTMTMTGGQITGGGNMVCAGSNSISQITISGGTLENTTNNSAVFTQGSATTITLKGDVLVNGNIINYGTMNISEDAVVTGSVSSRGGAGKNINISGGKFGGKLAIHTDTTQGTFVISGGKFASEPNAAWLDPAVGGLVVMKNTDADQGSYAYTVGKGYQNVGEFIDFGSSLAFSIYLQTGSDTMDAADECTVVQNKADGPVTLQNVSMEMRDGKLVVTAYGIAAKEMRDELTFTVTNGTQTKFTQTLSVYDAVCEWYAANDSAVYRTMLADMIAYGTQAQTEFGYNLAAVEQDPDLEGGSEYVEAWTRDENAYVTAGYESKVATSLNLNERIELNIYVEETFGPDELANATATLDGKEIPFTLTAAGEGMVRVTFDRINVPSVKGLVELRIGDFAVGTSVKEYVAVSLERNSQPQLMKALQKYVDSVCTYLETYVGWVDPGTNETGPVRP